MPTNRCNRGLEQDPVMMKLMELFERELDRRAGPDATFEQRRDIAVTVAAEALAVAAQQDQARDRTEVTHVPQPTEPEDPDD